ncbi:hypothetical protein EGT29_21935 [Pigmentiphaga sp. H8]|nr:hypothetical protein EGT29_21935 [Pigmentiphaga sp. H8]
MLDGLPGFLTIERGGILQATALLIEKDKVAAIYVTRNPDKLRHLDAASGNRPERPAETSPGRRPGDEPT